MNNFDPNQGDSGVREQLPGTSAKKMPSIDPVVYDGLMRSEHRNFVLKIDQDLSDLLSSTTETFLEYSGMNSYQRLVCHRVADLYYMDHVADKIRLGVTIRKTKYSRFPAYNLKKIPFKAPEDENLKITIQKQPKKNMDSSDAQKRQYSQQRSSCNNIQQASFEERAAAYETLRAKIFEGEEDLVDDTKYGNYNQDRQSRYVHRQQSNNYRPRYPNEYIMTTNPEMNETTDVSYYNVGFASSNAQNVQDPYIMQNGYMPQIFTDPYTGMSYYVPPVQDWDPNTASIPPVEYSNMHHQQFPHQLPMYPPYFAGNFNTQQLTIPSNTIPDAPLEVTIDDCGQTNGSLESSDEDVKNTTALTQSSEEIHPFPNLQFGSVIPSIQLFEDDQGCVRLTEKMKMKLDSRGTFAKTN